MSFSAVRENRQKIETKKFPPIDNIPETCFYTMSVYYLAAKVTKTRYTLPGALLSLAASAVMSLILARGMM